MTAALVWSVLLASAAHAQTRAGPPSMAPDTSPRAAEIDGDHTTQNAFRTFVLEPGMGFGAAIGLNGFGGSANGVLDQAVGYEVFVGGGTRSGLFIHGGAAFGGHDVVTQAAPWKYIDVFVEPRWVALDLSPVWAPFVAGRAGRVWERVIGKNYSFNGSGFSYGGGGGVVLRLAPQIALEAGGLIGRANFGNYTFRGEFAWKSCLDDLEAGTGLPESIARCAGSRSLGGAVRLCYPPYFTMTTSNCSPPDIPYENTSRDASWRRVWVGVHFSLATRSD